MNFHYRSQLSNRLFSRLAQTYSTPAAVQKLLRRFPYNRVDTVRSAYSAWKAGRAHCFEAALIAAAILEHRGYEPTVLFIDSKDNLGHVLFVFKSGQRWGAVARSRDEGLHGRAPVFSSLDQLVQSYWVPYVDATGWITGYSQVNLNDLPFSWRHFPKNMWSNEVFLTSQRQRRLTMPKKLHAKALRAYLSGEGLKFERFWW